jgi:NAD(P)H-hydrate epimerase
MSWPSVRWSEVPVAPASLMRRVDIEADRLFHISTSQLMEVAGFQAARFVADWLGGVSGRRILVVAGAGNNGGDALVAARFLVQRGATVSALCLAPKDPASPVANHARTLEAMGIACAPLNGSFPISADLVLDGLLGTGIRLPLREPLTDLIAVVNGAGTPVVAIDLPSGLDSESGEGDKGAIQAAATLTLGLPKPALRRARCRGRLFLADIGLPAALFGADEMAVSNLYRRGDLLEIVEAPQTPS